MAKLSSYFSFTNVLLLIAVITLVVISLALIRGSGNKDGSETYVENREFVKKGSSNKPVAEVFFFYADWCPHCKSAKPEWSKFKSEYNNTMVNGYKVVCIDVNCTTEGGETSKLMQTYDIQGFPTIKMKYNNTVYDYDAAVKEDRLVKFVQTMSA
jgi:thiol-disulfide isomerase/thioredoxin